MIGHPGDYYDLMMNILKSFNCDHFEKFLPWQFWRVLTTTSGTSVLKSFNQDFAFQSNHPLPHSRPGGWGCRLGRTQGENYDDDDDDFDDGYDDDYDYDD